MSIHSRWSPTTVTFVRKAGEWLLQMKFTAARLSENTAAKIDRTGLLNAALYKAWLHRHECRAASEGEARAWVAAIYARLLQDELRKAYARKEVNPDTGAGRGGAQLPPVADDPSRLVEDEDRLLFLKKQVNEALGELSPIRQTVLVHFYWNGLSMDQIAEMLGLTPEAVRQHAVRGRIQLRDILRQRLPDLHWEELL